MAVPKRRTSVARKNLRRSHHSISPKALVRCSNCNHAVMPHRVCGNCGHYRGKNVLHLELTD